MSQECTICLSAKHVAASCPLRQGQASDVRGTRIFFDEGRNGISKVLADALVKAGTPAPVVDADGAGVLAPKSRVFWVGSKYLSSTWTVRSGSMAIDRGPIADAIINLINSKPRSPTRDEIIATLERF